MDREERKVDEFFLGDARAALRHFLNEGRQAQLCYLDPPFCTGRDFRVYRDRYTSDEDYYAMMREVLQGAYELLTRDGNLFLHIDWRAQARLRLMLEEIFGAAGFRNEIIWSYRSGGRARTHFSRKHDTILFFAKSPANYFDAMQDPLPRREARGGHLKRGVDEDGRVFRAVRAGGKLYRYYEDEGVPASDVWTDIPHLQQLDPERVGYPNQKPLRLLRRIVRCASRPGDTVLDVFAGSGTSLVAAHELGRAFLGADSAPEALAALQSRLLGAPLRLTRG